MIPFFVWFFSCAGEETPPGNPEAPPPPGPSVRDLPDVVLVTLDTTRADRLGCYGYAQGATDLLDGLAARGRRYSRAYSPLPLTIPAHATLFTGRYPPTLGIRGNGSGKLLPEEVTLAERLQENGYRTAAAVAAFVTTREWGFRQGFDAYFDEIPLDEPGNFWHAERPANLVVDDILAWRAKQTGDAPLFAWIHLYDAHFPYAPPNRYVDVVQGRPYDGELAFVDDELARVVEAFGPDALYVVVGDHGEGLGQHHELTHGMYTYDVTQHVPWLMAGPGVDVSVIDEPVSLADVAPTLLSQLGLPALSKAEGRVVPGSTPKPVYMESYQLMERFGVAPFRGVVDGPYKLLDLPRPELYDVVADPLEQKDLSSERAAEVALLRAELDGFGYGPPLYDSNHPVDPAMVAQLQALGYVEGGFKGDLSGPLPDPKDRVDLVVKSQSVERMLRENRHEEVISELQGLIAKYPDVIEFRTRLAMALGRSGRVEEAGRLVEEALAMDPENATLKFSLGVQRANSRRFDEASILFREAADAMPYSPRIRTMAVAALLDGGDKEAALELGLEYFKQFPDDTSLAGVVGVALLREGRLAEGRELVRIGSLADKPEREVAYFRAIEEAALGNAAEAQRMLELELKNYPANPTAAKMLIASLVESKDWARQVEVASRTLAVSDSDPVLWHAKAQALFNQGKYDESRVALDEGLKRREIAILVLLDANLLSKEGKPDAAKARFEVAKQLRDKELVEAQTSAEREGAPGASLTPPH